MSDFTSRVQTIMGAHPLLNDGGYGLMKGHEGKFSQWRADLTTASSLAEVESLCEWIGRNLSPSKGINRRHTSYGLKHIAEREIGYRSNGQFILAALLLGYRSDFCGLNVHFNFTEDSIKRADRTVAKP